MDTSLLLELLERMSLTVTLAFLLSQTRLFRRLLHRPLSLRDRLALVGFFGGFGILGTYAGVPVEGALANIRPVGVMAAGFLGGPVLGSSAGFVAGAHRYLLGGFSDFACAVASVCEGLLAGCIQRRCSRRPLPWWVAFLGGLAAEGMQMVLLLLLARPYEQAQALVAEIFLPMTLANAAGVAVFVLIIRAALAVQDKVGAEAAQRALEIATKTLPYLRRGLTADTAQATAYILMDTAGYEAVAVTDTRQVLAFVGAESGRHGPGHPAAFVTRRALQTGRVTIAESRGEVGCPQEGCRLASVVVVPLRQAGAVVGSLNLCYTRPQAIGSGDIVFAEGLAHLFSTQLELTEIDRQAKLAARAELKALYAQINPHFLFNTLNTITSLVRTRPDQARELLGKLGSLFRYSLHKAGRTIPLEEELAQVRAYVVIEQARHGDKLRVAYEVEPAALPLDIPSMTLQPLVENAIRHGLQPKEEGGSLRLTVRLEEAGLVAQVADDGVGIDLAARHPLEAPEEEAIGLRNVHERLRGTYGGAYGLAIASRPGAGTVVTVRWPRQGEERDHVASTHCG